MYEVFRPSCRMAVLFLFSIIAFIAAIQPTESHTVVQSAVACQDKRLNITCSEGRKIGIVKALYGRKSWTNCWKSSSHYWNFNCEAPGSTSIVKDVCEGKKTCSLEATNDMFRGDPCENTEKYLEIQYVCRRPAAPVVTKTTCENGAVELECDLNERIDIVDALFGRMTDRICWKWYAFTWNVNCKSSHSHDAVRELCQGKRTCTVLAKNRVFIENPCIGTEKYLSISYRCLNHA